MLKITQPANPSSRRVFVLEGRIAGPWIAELRDLCEITLREGASLTLDLSGVAFVDRAGVSLLGGLCQRRVVIIGGTPFVTEQLHEAGVWLAPEVRSKTRGSS